MPPKPLLSGLAWRVALIVAAIVLILAMLYTGAQLIGVLSGGVGFV